MSFLFIATLGPVQPFIASARRTRDLYVGSTLLSELSKAAANAIAGMEGTESLIFPAPSDKSKLQAGSLLNVANKIVAVVQQQEPARLGKQVHDAILQRLEQVRIDAFGSIELADKERARWQIENLIEYAWVAVPLKQDEEYGHALMQAETVLAARKNTHFFREVTWGDHVAKSSIDGLRESVIPSTYYLKSQGNKDSNARQLYNIYKAGPHEHLSAVDLLKRLAWLDEKREAVPESLPLILSTSHIAAMPFLQKIHELQLDDKKKEEAIRLWTTYIENVKGLVPSENGRIFSPIIEKIPRRSGLRNSVIDFYDGSLLFKERLLDDAVFTQKLTDAYAALEKFFKFTDKHLDGMRPSPYYAILLADGDGMGKLIEGLDTRKKHQNLSRILAQFAESVRNIVDNKYSGSLIYAGGDDVMALLPLHTVLDCAKELSETFKGILRDISGGGKSPTLSVGIAVVHHISLLLDGLGLAREAERKAKDYLGDQDHPDKNALAIIVKKRGGEQNEMVVSWEHYEARLDLLVELYKADILPRGMAYELRAMMERLQTSRQDERNVHLQRIMQLEAARILRRKLYFSRKRQAGKQDTQIKQIVSRQLTPGAVSEETMKLLLQQIGMRECVDGGFEVMQTQHIAPFINALIVAQTFTGAFKPEQVKGEIV